MQRKTLCDFCLNFLSKKVEEVRSNWRDERKKNRRKKRNKADQKKIVQRVEQKKRTERAITR